MPMNNGKFIEVEIVDRLNGKRVKDLSHNLRNLMNALYGVLDGKQTVAAEVIEDYIKPDFVITYRGEKKYVSMKTGRAETVHQEYIKSFVLFLRSLGVSKRTQQTILLYQYGDGTLDGSAKERIEYNRFRLMMEKRIEEANEELNQSKEFVMKVIERCLILGTLENAIPIDCVYFGDCEFGHVATKKQIAKHIQYGNWKWMKNLHIGPLQIRPHARYVGKEIRNPKRRERVDLYWPNLSADIAFIAKRYDY